MAYRLQNIQALCRFISEIPSLSVGLEVGVLHADCSSTLLRTFPVLEMWLVDQWLSDYDMFTALSNLRSHQGRYRIVRMDCLVAAAILQHIGFRFDFVYLDVEHSTRGMSQYIDRYKEVIKRNGYMCGSGYLRRNANRAIRRFRVHSDGDFWWWQKG